jgi:predicted transcriptional regulator
MYGSDSQTPFAQSQLEQLDLNSQTPKIRKLHPSVLFEIASSEVNKKMIARLLQEEFVEAKDLQEATGLSRSASLKRAENLVEKGTVHRRKKPGTENRHKPPYIFYLDPEVKSQLAVLVQEKEAEQHVQPKHEEIEESGQDLQLDELQLSSTEQESKQLDSSNELIKEVDNATERKQEATSKFDEGSQSLEKRVGIVLTQMAKEIAALRNRVAYLERKLEQKIQDTDSFDFGQVLNILEPRPNGKDTT